MGSSGFEEGQFLNPMGIAIAPSGNVFVSDVNNNRIQKFSSEGNFLFSWDASNSPGGKFAFPKSIDIDEHGNVFVAETGNHRIRVFSENGNPIASWGSGGRGEGNFLAPVGIAVSPPGLVYVSDHNNYRIQVFTIALDFQAPIIRVPSAITVETESDQGSIIKFEVTATDNVKVVSGPSCNYSSGNNFGIGSTVVTCTAFDAAGNKGTDSFTVTVNLVCGEGTILEGGICVPIVPEDILAPVLHLPKNTMVETSSNDGMSIPFRVTATDNVKVVSGPSCNYSSGNNFGIGSTVVTCTAFDAAGNKGTDSFTVTVNLVCGEDTILEGGICVPIEIEVVPSEVPEIDNSSVITIGATLGAAAAGGLMLATKAGILSSAKTSVLSTGGSGGEVSSSSTQQQTSFDTTEIETEYDPFPQIETIELEIRGGFE